MCLGVTLAVLPLPLARLVNLSNPTSHVNMQGNYDMSYLGFFWYSKPAALF